MSIVANITNATNTAPIVITSAAHGFTNGQVVVVASVGGNTGANGTWTITDASANAFSLKGSEGNGAYTTGGTATLVEAATGNITGATNASPVVITSASHGLSTGHLVQITGVEGNTSANGVWAVTVVNANSFSLDNSAGSGAYTTGGAWVRTYLATGATVSSSEATRKLDIAETASFTGADDISLSATVVAGSGSMGAFNDGERIYYDVVEVDGSGVPNGENETGIGIYHADTNTIERVEVLGSSLGLEDGFVDFGVGTKQVTATYIGDIPSAEPFAVSAPPDAITIVIPVADMVITEAERLHLFSARWGTYRAPNIGNVGNQGLLGRSGTVARLGLAVGLLMMPGDEYGRPFTREAGAYDGFINQGHLSVTGSTRSTQRAREGESRYISLIPVDQNPNAVISLKAAYIRGGPYIRPVYEWINHPLISTQDQRIVPRFFIDLDNLPALPFRTVTNRANAITNVPAFTPIDIFMDGSPEVDTVASLFGFTEKRPKMFAMPWYSPVARNNGLSGTDMIGHDLTTHQGVVCLNPRIAANDGWMNETHETYYSHPSRYLYLGTVCTRRGGSRVAMNLPGNRLVWNHYNRLPYEDQTVQRNWARIPPVARRIDGGANLVWHTIPGSGTAFTHSFIVPDVSEAENSAACPRADLLFTTTAGPIRTRVVHQYLTSPTGRPSSETCYIISQPSDAFPLSPAQASALPNGQVQVGNNSFPVVGDSAAVLSMPRPYRAISTDGAAKWRMLNVGWATGISGAPSVGIKGYGSYVAQYGFTDGEVAAGENLQDYWTTARAALPASQRSQTPEQCYWGFYGEAGSNGIRMGHAAVDSGSGSFANEAISAVSEVKSRMTVRGQC